MSDDEGRPAQNLQDWEILQAKIFTKWVNQKLMSRHFPVIENVQFDLGKETHLRNLMFALTEKEVPEEKKKPSRMPVMKAQRIDQLGKDLALVFDAGIQMKLKPSVENLYDGDFKDTMSLVWAIMQKFIKFEDDEDGENLSAKDALLRWLQFHTKSYGLEVANLTKSFHNGMAFCALIHKFKPSAFDYAALDPENKKVNLQLAIDKAEELFGIEKYLSPEDIPKLDDKAMLVYCSEYYYAINEQAKRALAAKRISKLIKFTRENDAAKAHYEEQGKALLTHLEAAEGLLKDILVVDNTMGGAQKRLDDFDKYKADHKRSLISIHLDMESGFKTLAMKLANHNRPAYTPSDASLTLESLSARKEAIIAKESHEPQLHAELNRQRRLVQLNKRHETQAAKLNQWIGDKNAYVSGDFTVTSSGEARKQLKIFDSFLKEKDAMSADTFANLKKLGQSIIAEKYENSDAVSGRETDIASLLAALDAAASAKKPELEDSLARELFKEKVELDVKVHTEIYQSVSAWCAEKESYLKTKEVSNDVHTSYLHLSNLDSFEQEKKDMDAGAVTRLSDLGESIRAAKYETQYSQWVYSDPDAVKTLESTIAGSLTTLGELSVAKRAVLDDDLAREQFKEKIHLLVNNHQSLFNNLTAWSQKKEEYLDTKESVTSSTEAKQQLAFLNAFEKEKGDMTAGAFTSLTTLGNEIRAAEYSTEHSTWKYQNPAAVSDLETKMAGVWETLLSKLTAKRAVLDDDLERELYAESTRLMASRHSAQKDSLAQFCATKTTQYNEEIVVNSIADAQFLLSQLASLEQEREAALKSSVVSFKALKDEILARKYQTSHSSYVYEEPDTIKALDAEVDGSFASIASLASTRKSTLEDLLAKEQKKEELRLEFASLAAAFMRMTQDKVASIGTEEEQRTMHGFSLEEVEAYNTTLTADENETKSTAEARKTAYTGVLAQMEELACNDNPYTTHTAADLDSAWATVDTALTARRTFYDSELARHRENDALCKQFAGMVDPFENKVNGLMVAALSSSKDEEEQLSDIVAAVADAPGIKLDFAAASALEKDISSRGVLLNPHTVMSVDDVQLTWDNYMQVLERRQPYLESIVAYRKFRGITPEQYAEMEEIFKTFDKDGSNSINEKELRSCLFSLGEERTKAEIQDYMKKFGSGGALGFGPFRELMITLLGDTGTVESTCESFKVITRGRAGVSEADLVDLLSDDETAYLRASAGDCEELPGTMDFATWVADVFSR